MEVTRFYAFSNGGKETYPNNTLTNFTNSFPIPLEVQQSYELGIQSIGFSSMFRNIILPPKNVPSVIVTNCNSKVDYYMGSSHFMEEEEGPIKWTFNEHNARTCVYEKHTFPDPTDPTGNEELVVSLPTKCAFQQCFYSYFSLKDINYTNEEVEKLCNEIQTATGVTVKYTNRKIHFSLDQNWIEQHKTNRCYIFMHETFVNGFGFDVKPLRRYISKSDTWGGNMRQLIRVMQIGSAQNVEHFVRQIRRKSEKYYVFYISLIPKDETNPVRMEISLVSNNLHLDRPQFPKTIKIVCSQIEPQIYNNEYAQNILVYTPDFNSLDSFTTQEIETVDYMPLQNTLLTNINFKILDEKNNFLQLLPGQATWLKLVLRSAQMEKKSFNVVLTSEVSGYGDANQQSRFRVRLPRPLTLSSQWKVCLTSISHPSTFATFLPHENEQEKTQMMMERSLLFAAETTPNIADCLTFKADYNYDEAEIIENISNFLHVRQYGSCSYTKTLDITFRQNGYFYVGEALANVLGFSGTFERHLHNANMAKIQIRPEQLTYSFPRKFQLNYYHPKYLMVYANIIQPIVVAGEYRKLLRISPVESSTVAYVTKYFRHKEFNRLETTIIDVIEIIVASHDGRRIYFGSTQDIVLNLEFAKNVR